MAVFYVLSGNSAKGLTQPKDRPNEIPTQGKCRHDRSAPMGGQRRRAIRGQEPRLERTANHTQIFDKGGKSL